MEQFKIIFLDGYKKIKNIYNDKCRIHVLFESGKMYFATLITTKKVNELMDKYSMVTFLESNVLIIRDLNKETIMKGIELSIDSGYYENLFLEVDMIEHYRSLSYEEIEHMNDLPQHNLGIEKLLGIDFKVIFPTGYNNTNIDNDNIDVNIVFETGQVFSER